jgi:hypothetical protein
MDKLPDELLVEIAINLAPCDKIALSQTWSRAGKLLNPVWTLDLSGSKFPIHHLDAALERAKIPNSVYRKTETLVFGPETYVTGKDDHYSIVNA